MGWLDKLYKEIMFASSSETNARISYLKSRILWNNIVHSNRDKLNGVTDFLKFVFLFGFLLNLIFWSLAGWAFISTRILGLGLIFYFVKFEYTTIRKMSR